jgi:WD40 repeat protein
MTPPDAGTGGIPLQRLSCPYVGLQPFRTEHAPFFFGRERDQRLIIANLVAQPLTILYGASGVGKSSVLNAGVVPQLHRQRPAAPVIVFSEWARADFRRELARRCIEAAWATGTSQPKPSDELPLDVVLRACAEAAHETIAVIFDQFEEYFVYQPKATAADSFEAEFARAVNREDVDVGFLLALRDDGLAKLDRFQERIPNLLSNRLRLRHLDEAGARMAVRGPLDAWNASLAPGEQAVTADDALLDALIPEVRVGRVSVARRAGTGSAAQDHEDETRIEAPFLQLVLLRLWEKEQEQRSNRLRPETLQSLGGAKAIVGQHLDVEMARLNEIERAVCASIFDRLVTPTGSKIACSLAALAGWAGPALAPHVPDVLQALCRARILRPTELTDERDKDAFEVFHDVLAPAILDWRSRYITAREQEAAVQRERSEAAERAERERDELNRRAERQQAAIKRRSLVRLLVASGVLIVIAVAGWCYSFIEGTRAAANHLAAEALLAVSRDDPPRALDLALKSVARTAAWALPATSAGEDALRQSLRILPNREQKIEVADEVGAVAVSPDGQLVASGGKDKAVTLWELRDRQLSRYGAPLPQEEIVRELMFLRPGNPAEPGRLLVVAGSAVRMIDLARPEAKPTLFEHGSPIYHAFTVSADQRRMVTAGWAGDGRAAVMKVWSLQAPDVPAVELDLHGAWAMNLAFSPDGCCVATALVQTGGVGRTFTDIWSIASRQQIASVPNPTASDAVSFLPPDGNALITIGRGGLARIFRPANGDLRSLLATAAGRSLQPGEVATIGAAPAPPAEPAAITWETAVLAGHTDRIRDLAITADGNRLATAAGDGTVRIWDAAGGQTLFTLRGHTRYVEAATFTPDGRYLISGSRDRTLRLWDVGRHAGGVNAIAYAPEGDRVATAGVDGTVKLWDVSGDIPLLQRTLLGHRQEVYRLAFDPSGEWLASVGFDNQVYLWPLAADDPPIRLADHADQLRDIGFDGQGRWLASVAADGTAHLYDFRALTAAIQQAAAALPPPPPLVVRHDPGRSSTQVHSVALGPRLWATGGSDGVLRLWGWDGEDRGRITARGVTIVRDLAFSPDGRELAALGTRTVLIWPESGFGVAGARPRRVDLGRNCSSVSYANGGTLVVGCWDGSVSLFDAGSGELIRTVTPHNDRVNTATLSPDGRRLATASADGTFLVAPLDFRALRDLALRLQSFTRAASSAAD